MPQHNKPINYRLNAVSSYIVLYPLLSNPEFLETCWQKSMLWWQSMLAAIRQVVDFFSRAEDAYLC
jgi:hypothetical protein